MTDGFLNIDSTGIARHVSLAWGHYPAHADGMSENRLRIAVGWLPIAMIVMAAGWLLLSHARGPAAIAGPMPVTAAGSANSGAVNSTVGLAKESPFNSATSEAIVPEQPAPVDRLTISSQSWRRGGLG